MKTPGPVGVNIVTFEHGDEDGIPMGGLSTVSCRACPDTGEEARIVEVGSDGWYGDRELLVHTVRSSKEVQGRDGVAGTWR